MKLWTTIEKDAGIVVTDIENFFSWIWFQVKNWFSLDGEAILKQLIPIAENAFGAYVAANPGVAFLDAIIPVVNAIKADLPNELKELEDSAISFAVSLVAGKASIIAPTVAPGNAGTLEGGVQQGG